MSDNVRVNRLTPKNAENAAGSQRILMITSSQKMSFGGPLGA